MRLTCASLIALALLSAPSAAGDDDFVETKIGKTFTANFLDFKLSCKHDVEFQYSVEGVVEPVDDSGQTGSSKIKFKALAVGGTIITATFTGAGGNCVGTAMGVVEVSVLPDFKYTDKAWKLEVKDFTKAYAGTIHDMDGDVHDTIDDIVFGFQEGDLSSDEAAFALSIAAEVALDEAAVAGINSLLGLSATGSDLLGDGGLTEVPDGFAAGAEGSRWDGGVDDVIDDYEDFVDDVYEDVEDALDYIAFKRAQFRSRTIFVKRFPFSIPRGPGLADDVVDYDMGGPEILGGIAWSDGSTGRVRWFGTALMSGEDVALQVTGPAGFVTVDDIQALAAFIAGPSFGRWAIDLTGLDLAGNYLLGVRYDRDDHILRKVNLNLGFKVES